MCERNIFIPATEDRLFVSLESEETEGVTSREESRFSPEVVEFLVASEHKDLVSIKKFDIGKVGSCEREPISGRDLETRSRDFNKSTELGDR